MNLYGELKGAQIENVAGLPANKPEGRIVRLTTDGFYYVSDGTTWVSLVRSAEIQDYTVVGVVGDALQQFAGRDYSLAELEAYFTAGNVLAYYRFAAGALLVDDDKGDYDLTLPGGGADPANTTGIMNTNFASVYGGADYFTIVGPASVSLWEAAAQMTNGIAGSFWFNAADGQPGTENMFLGKVNDETGGTIDMFSVSLGTNGQIQFNTWANVAIGTTDYMKSSTTFTNAAATGWHHVAFCWDTTNGKRLWIDRKLENQNIAATTLIAAGATRDFTFGCAGYTGIPQAGTLYTGDMANACFLNHEFTQADVDWLYATTIPLPAVLQSVDCSIDAFMKPAVAGAVSQVWCDEVQRDATRVLISGGTRRRTDYYRLTGVL